MMDDDAYREHVRSLRDALRSAPAHLYTHRDTSPERNAARQAIVDDAWSELGGDDIPKGRQGLILGGLPGSGKTQVRNSAEVPGVGPVASHFLPIDPDYFKGKLIDAGLAPSLPGFAPMETAPLMHKESNDLAKALARKAYGEGTNIAWDYSLRHPHSPDSRMAEFDHYGYTPHGIYVHADPAVALARTKKRHRDDLEAYLAGQHPHGGRYVPPEIIGDSVHGDRIANRDNYDRLARHLATSQVFDTTGGSQRTAMPYTPEEFAAIRSDRNHPNHYDLGNYHELPQNTLEEKESPRPEHLYRGIRVKGPVGPQEIQSIISNGLGSHWTSDIQNAAAFGDPDNHDEGHDYPGAANYPGPKNTGLIFTIRHPGAEHVISNPDGGHVNASYWNDEHEHSLAPDAPMHVVQVYMKSGPGQKFQPVNHRTAHRTAEYSSQPLNVRDNYTMADFFQWCAHNHKQPTTDNLAEFAAVSGMDTESYLDNYLFLSREDGLFRESAIKFDDTQRLHNIVDVVNHIGGLSSRTIRHHISNGDFPRPTHLANSGVHSVLWDSLDPWDEWLRRYEKLNAQPKKSKFPVGWAADLREGDEPKRLYSMKDIADDLGMSYGGVNSWFKRDSIRSKPPAPTHLVNGGPARGASGDHHYWDDLDVIRQWYEQYKNPQISNDKGGVVETLGQGDLLEKELPMPLDNKTVLDTGERAKVLDAPPTTLHIPNITAPAKPQATICPNCFTQHAGECL